MSTEDQCVLLLRLEGPLQSWGTPEPWVVRDTAAEPTKSGVIGLLCCALGRSRKDSFDDLNQLRLGVRVDRPGILWRDYHTVGAGVGVMAAHGKIKRTQSTKEIETLISDRRYLCDASFLAALMGSERTLEMVREALRSPAWPIFLGRKACVPSTPVLAPDATIERFPDLLAALRSVPWRPRLARVDNPPGKLRCVIEANSFSQSVAERWDVPRSFASGSRSYDRRLVQEVIIDCPAVGEPLQTCCPAAFRGRMNYSGAAWGSRRRARALMDNALCVFCRLPSSVCHHVTYARANNEDVANDLRSVCRLCHDAITMLESERGMTRERVDPLSEQYRNLVLAKRAQILARRAPRHPRTRST